MPELEVKHGQISASHFSDTLRSDSSSRSGQISPIDRNHVEVKSDLAAMDSDRNDGSFLSGHSDSLVDGRLTQSARIASSNQAGFDAQKTPVLKTGEAEEKKELDAKKKKAQSIAIEPCKSSKYGWLIRVRLHSEPDKPAIPISYMTDAEYKQLRRSKKRYEDFKNNIKKQYQKTTWQGDDAGADSDCA